MPRAGATRPDRNPAPVSTSKSDASDGNTNVYWVLRIAHSKVLMVVVVGLSRAGLPVLNAEFPTSIKCRRIVLRIQAMTTCTVLALTLGQTRVMLVK